jgi:hypothetical protein
MIIAAPIPEDRQLTSDEVALVRWLLAHDGPDAAGFLPQLADARVVSRCPCGCASIDFAVGGVAPPSGAGMHVLADFEYRTAEGFLCGVFVFERYGLLAGLEVWSQDGLSTPNSLPSPSQLQPLGGAQDAGLDGQDGSVFARRTLSRDA